MLSFVCFEEILRFAKDWHASISKPEVHYSDIYITVSLFGDNKPHHQTKKEENPFDCLLQYPLRGSTALHAVGSRVLASLHPPDLPEREATPGFSPEGIKQKIRWKTIGPFVVPPQGLEPWTPTLRVSCSTN